MAWTDKQHAQAVFADDEKDVNYGLMSDSCCKVMTPACFAAVLPILVLRRIMVYSC
jgi:hypothetical protein